MTIKIWSDYKRFGLVMTPYSMIRSLGVLKAVVLAQIIAEYNHACNKNLNLGQFFLCDGYRMADYLGLEAEELAEIFCELRDLHFISLNYSGIKDILMVSINQDEIIKYQKREEVENMYDNWDMGLSRAQNPINRQTDFIPSVQKLKDFIEEYISSDKVQIVVYSYCNMIIKEYEEEGKNFWEIENIEKNLKEILLEPSFGIYKLASFIHNLLN